MTIPSSSIGLPTTGAKVTSATYVPASTGQADGEYCKVIGEISPVDPHAQNIRFEVNLPTTWNHKALQIGGGGYDGRLITGLGQPPFGPMSGPTPTGRGYATFGSDSGHEGTVADGSFATNDETLANFGGDQIKKTHDAVLAIIKARYGATPARVYFAGNSQGGHETLLAIQRWPQDYDGAIATHPVYDFTMVQIDGNYLARKAYANHGAGWLNPNKVKMLQAAVMDACDGLDGVKDGIISNVAACRKAFHISTLRCPGGVDSGDSCLSDAQIEFVNTLNSPLQLDFALAHGLNSFPRWPILEGGDWTDLFTLGHRAQPSVPPTPTVDFGLAVLSDPMIRFFVTKDPNFNSLTFDPNHYQQRLVELSNLIDANNPDLSAFKNRGGKLLLMHGTVDTAVSPYNTINYYNRMVGEFGQSSLDDFVRFYMVPGFGHGTGQFIASWDSLGALENWVEHGAAPGELVVTDSTPGHNGRSMPMCVYPKWPRYNGTGDVNAASSFTCVTG